MIESKVLSQVLEILLNQLKCFVSRLPRNKHEQKSRIVKNNKGNEILNFTSSWDFVIFREY